MPLAWTRHCCLHFVTWRHPFAGFFHGLRGDGRRFAKPPGSPRLAMAHAATWAADVHRRRRILHRRRRIPDPGASRS